MKVFIAPEMGDIQSDFKLALQCLHQMPKIPQIYLVGDMSDWATVQNLNFDGLLQTPPTIRAILDKDVKRGS